MRSKTVYYAMGNHSVRKIHFKCTPLRKTKKKNWKSVFSVAQTRENSCSTKLLAAMFYRSVFWQLNIIHFVHKFVILKWNRIKKKTFLPTLIASRERISRMNRRKYTAHTIWMRITTAGNTWQLTFDPDLNLSSLHAIYLAFITYFRNKNSDKSKFSTLKWFQSRQN